MIHERLRDLGARSWRMTRDMHNKFKGELWREEIPYLKSIEEADTVLVDMYKCGKIDVIMSTDMDYLMAGVERMFIPSVASAHPIFQEVLLQDVLTNECMNFESFQEACILCGTDVTKEFCRMEPARAFSYIRYYATIKNMVRLKKDFIPPQFTEEYIESVKQRWRVVSGAWDNARPDHLARLVEKGMLTL
jgi:5'-3' exonuclease